MTPLETRTGTLKCGTGCGSYRGWDLRAYVAQLSDLLVGRCWKCNTTTLTHLLLGTSSVFLNWFGQHDAFVFGHSVSSLLNRKILKRKLKNHFLRPENQDFLSGTTWGWSGGWTGRGWGFSKSQQTNHELYVFAGNFKCHTHTVNNQKFMCFMCVLFFFLIFF